MVLLIGGKAANQFQTWWWRWYIFEGIESVCIGYLWGPLLL